MKFIIGVVCGFIGAWGLMSSFKSIDEKVDVLKNSVLTVALAKMRQSDFEYNSHNSYTAFDGSKLPEMSGCSILNACMSYLYTSPIEALREPFPIYIMYQKQIAIHKYLQKNFSSMDKIDSFVLEYIKVMLGEEEEEGK